MSLVYTRSTHDVIYDATVGVNYGVLMATVVDLFFCGPQCW